MDDIFKLLEQYKNFTESSGSKNLKDFGKWLVTTEKANIKFSTGKAEPDGHGINAMISYMLGGMIGYAEAWLKISYQDLPVSSLIDFGVLKTVQYLHQPTKSEIAENVIAERTTTIEAIKRLIAAGLLREKQDDVDKRMRRVYLTEKGRKLIGRLDQKMIALGNLLVGDLSNDEKQEFAILLKKLNNFHQRLYKGSSRSMVKEKFSL